MECRPHRFLFNALTAASLVLCVGVCVLWARSYSIISPSLQFSDARQRLFVSRGWLMTDNQPLIVKGEVAYSEWRVELRTFLAAYARERRAEPPSLKVLPSEPPPGTPVAPVVAAYVDRRLLPLPIPAAVFVVLPVMSLARASRRPARRVGDCSSCGYSLTGNVSGTCPECGAAAKAVSA